MKYCGPDRFVGALGARPGNDRYGRNGQYDRYGPASQREQQDRFLHGTGGDRILVTYRNRMGRKRQYTMAFEGLVANLAPEDLASLLAYLESTKTGQEKSTK